MQQKSQELSDPKSVKGNMNQINGRQKFAGNSPIEQMLGKRVFASTYFTNDFDEYSKWLSYQNLMDLHKHSLEVLGEMTKGDRAKTIARLENGFKRAIGQSEAYKANQESQSTPIPKDKQEALLELLKGGV